MVDPEAVMDTPRLRLEPLREGHAAEMFPVLSDERLYRFIPSNPPATPAALAARYRSLESRSSPDGQQGWLNWIVRDGAEGACMGSVQVTLRPDRSAYLAYELGTAYQGRGYATEACRRVLAALFETDGVERIVAEVDSRNEASLRLLDRLGFLRGPLRRNADVFKGASSDEYTFTLERSDWV